MGSGSIATAKCGELRRGAAGELAEGRGHHCEQAAKHAQRGNFLATMSLTLQPHTHALPGACSGGASHRGLRANSSIRAQWECKQGAAS